jgi:hypothetical protein
MRTRASDFGAAILVAAAEPYVDRAVWVEPTKGCSDGSPKSLPKFRVSDTLTRGGPNKDSQERSAWFARHVPGGLAFGRASDDDHRPIIRLTDPTQKLAALATLDSLAPQNGRTRVSMADSFTAVRVRWDFAELYDWMQYLQTGFSAGRRVPMNGAAIDTNNDRLAFFVEKSESVPILVSWLIERGVPCRLVVVRVTGPIRGL